MQISDRVESYIREVVHLNATSSYTLLSYIEGPIKNEFFYQIDDTYQRLYFEELRKPSALRFIPGAMELLSNDNIPSTIKELFVIAARQRKNFYFWKRPINAITDFLKSIDPNQLKDLSKIKSLISEHNLKAQKNSSIIQLKSLNDRFISDLIHCYFELMKYKSDTIRVITIFKTIQKDTEVFLDRVEYFLENIENQEINEYWNNIRIT
ncbi:hypothetical protein FPK74_18980, partial [Acinetobacter baumannii]